MDRLSRWRRRRPGGPTPSGSDPELWELFGGQEGEEPAGLAEAAEELRRRLRELPPETGDPRFQGRLRANLMAEARSRVRSPRHRLGFALGTGAGAVGVAMVAVVVLSLVLIPRPGGTVNVRAAVSGHHRLAVTSAIRLGFSQPMDEAEVDQGLKITPAVAFKLSWPDPKTLVISPQHGLAPNVGYVVTIAKPDAVAQDGAKASSEIVIPFGTGTTPPSAQGQPPALVSVNPVEQVGGQASLLYAQDGDLLLLCQGAPAPTGADLASPSPTPSPSASPSTSAPASGRSLYLLDPSPELIATDVLRAAVSPDSQEIAYWTPAPGGGLVLEVVPAQGGAPQTLTSSDQSNPGLAWLDDGDLLYSSSGQLHQVSLDGQISAVDPNVELSPSGFFLLSPSGQELFSSPASVPTIFSLVGGGSSQLPGLVGLPAWSPSGGQVVYVDQSEGLSDLEISSDSGAQSTQLLQAPSGAELGGLQFDPSGSYLAYVETASLGVSQLELIDVQSQAVATLGSFTELQSPVWAPDGNQLSAVAESTAGGAEEVDSLLLSGASTGPAEGGAAQELALTTAASLAQLQVSGEPGALTAIEALLTPDASIGSSVLLPGRFDRFYAVSASPSSSSATVYTVQLRLVRDATSSTGPAYLAETVTVQTQGSPPLITALGQGVLTPVPPGPVVLSASATTTASGATAVAIQFNSDLNPATVGPQSISILVGGEPVSNLEFSYAPLTRTVTVTATSLPPGALTLTVSSPLADVDNTPLHSTFQVVLRQGSASPG